MFGFKGPRKMSVVIPAMTPEFERYVIRPTKVHLCYVLNHNNTVICICTYYVQKVTRDHSCGNKE